MQRATAAERALSGRAPLPCAAIRLWLAAWLLHMLVVVGPASADDRNLRVAWSDQPPYQYLEHNHKRELPTGVDLEIMREAAARAGLSVTFQYHPFGESLRRLAAGDIDAVVGAYDTAARRAYADVSSPYRLGLDRIFLPPDNKIAATDSAAAIAEELRQRGLRLAVVADFDWGADGAAAIETLRRHDLILETDSLPESVAAVLDGAADGFLGDQLSGLALLSLWDAQHINPLPWVVQERGIHILLARETLPDWQLARFNDALEGMIADGTVDHILQQFTNPLAIGVVFHNSWVEIFFVVGIVAFSISGIVIARQGEYSIFGAFVLASLPALGGGVLRDILLLRKPDFFDAPGMIYTCLLTILVGYLFNRFLDAVRGRALWFFDLVNLFVRLRRRADPRLALEFFDAIGLALFTVVAISITAEEGLAPLWFWGPLIGALSATGGAILRDMIRSEAHNPILHTSFYGETAILWGVLLALFLQFEGPYATTDQVLLAVAVCVGGIIVTRMSFVIFKIPTPKY